MTVETTIQRNNYIGNNSTDEYSYTFPITNEDQLYLVMMDELGAVQPPLVLNVDYTVSGVGDEDGGLITLLGGVLETGWRLSILREVSVTQDQNITNQGQFFPRIHEDAFDHFVMIDQQQQEQIDRSVKLPVILDPSMFDPTLPLSVYHQGENRFLKIKDDGTGFEVAVAGSGGSGGAIPEGGSDYSLLERDFDTDDQTVWTAPLVYQGFSERFSQVVDLQGIKPVIDYIMDMGYAPPTVSLGTNPNYATIREKGATISSVDLTASIVRVLNDIAEVRFYRGVTLLDTQTSGGGIPSGGNSTFTDSNSFSDNRSYSVQVDDDSAQPKPSATSTRNFVFVYPYYYGVGAAGLGAGVSALTKQIIQESTNAVRSFSPNGSEKMYFAYPASYGALSSILDINSFNTIGDWTLTTTNITGLDGNPVSYHIYEFNNFAVADTYQYTFIQ